MLSVLVSGLTVSPGHGRHAPAEVVGAVAAGHGPPGRGLIEAVTRVSRPQPRLGRPAHAADLDVALAELQTIDPPETVRQRGAETRDLVILVINLLLQSAHSEKWISGSMILV